MSFRRLKFTGFTDRRRRQLAKRSIGWNDSRPGTRSPNRSASRDLRLRRSRERRLGLIPAFGASNALSGLKPPPPSRSKPPAREASRSCSAGNLLKPIPSVETVHGAGGSSTPTVERQGPELGQTAGGRLAELELDISVD